MQPAVSLKRPEQGMKILRQVLHYVDRHLTTVKGVSEIASAVFVSDSYVYQLFQKKLGISPKKYVNVQRLQLAKEYICAGEQPSTVYLKCGFKDYSAFFRAYKALFGYAPIHTPMNTPIATP